MATFFSSDLHFGHARVLDLCARPFADLDAMNAAILDRFSIVGPDDDLYLLGDVAMGDRAVSLKLVAALPGRKFLVPGNHDHVHPMFGVKAAKFADLYADAGLTVLDTVVTLDLGGVVVTLSHFPYASGDLDHAGRDITDHVPADHGGVLLHGHTHARTVVNGRMIHVGVDAHGYAPISADDVRSLIHSI